MKKTSIVVFTLLAIISYTKSQAKNPVIWQIGENDNSASEFALAPNDYARFIEKDFGWEDKYFLIVLLYEDKKRNLDIG